MTALLTQNVKLYDGFPPGTGTITINDDDSFVLTKIDSSTNQPISTIYNTPMSQLQVRGRGTALRFLAGGIRKRGADVRYLSYWQRIALTWAIAIVFIVVVVGIFVLVALGQH
jgi:hypothetical protein